MDTVARSESEKKGCSFLARWNGWLMCGRGRPIALLSPVYLNSCAKYCQEDNGPCIWNSVQPIQSVYERLKSLQLLVYHNKVKGKQNVLLQSQGFWGGDIFYRTNFMFGIKLDEPLNAEHSPSWATGAAPQ